MSGTRYVPPADDEPLDFLQLAIVDVLTAVILERLQRRLTDRSATPDRIRPVVAADANRRWSGLETIDKP